ncbi:MAG: hypothetical protein ACOC0N_05320 [Chroococcales cyanobacterium]
MSNQHLNITKRKLARTGAISLGVAALLFLPACGGEEPVVERNVTREEVAEETEQLIGRTVTVRGEPQQTVGDASFTMAEGEVFGGEEILILNASGTPFVLPTEDIEVQVTGEVAQFVLADVETDYGLDLDDEIYLEYEGQPTIIAESIALAPRPDEISEAPDLFYGNTLAVEEEIEQMYSENAFTFGDGTLVLVPNPERPFSEGEQVVATGVLQPYVEAEIEQEYNWAWWERDREIIAEFEEQPVLIADDVYPSAVEEPFEEPGL